ncbi:hypothetical protein BP6252_01437 [Coleophoma cylindrospora]|uniref:UFSP1/2/DUB catalytic domain-containing protein n=1 Tax=Coleophoma cylindrospora TaxID=1849047 RepID=A0A3D8SSY9_9HELO|nr:hypothetical protein BP6252_01437 [Coleophoma cylindrospora]
METLHAEGESPFVVRDDASVAALISPTSDSDHNKADEDVQYANCPVDGCGEVLLLSDFDNHIRLHDVEDSDAEMHLGNTASDSRGAALDSDFGTKLSDALQHLDDGSEEGQSEPPHAYAKALSSQHEDHRHSHKSLHHTSHNPPIYQERAKTIWKQMLNMPEKPSKVHYASSSAAKPIKKTLGKAELGPYYKEKQMPSWLVHLLETEDGAVKTINKVGTDGKLKKLQFCENQQGGVIPVIAQLLEQEPLTEYAYLCHPAVKHVSKLKREGGFCGYRNIQMLTSYITGVNSQGFEHFQDKIPTIFQIQDWIETAWDLGINASGRIETGGIKGTRKYIGTPDAQAMFLSLGIAVDAQAFKTSNGGRPADQQLLAAVERYFHSGSSNHQDRVRCTDLPPIYYQQPGHSMTIVGFERMRDGSSNLLMFDPMFHDASSVIHRVNHQFTHKSPEKLLKAYRRDVKYLRRYKEFETLK